jgi:hypothetical protein
MTGLPRSTVSISNGNLGKTEPNEDGIAAIIVSGVAVSGKFALGDSQGPFTSLKDAEDNGITAAYDVTNTCLAHQHIADFYAEAGNGAKLHVMVVAKTLTMAMIADKTLAWAKKMLSEGNRAIKLLGITRVPDGAYAPTYTGQLDPDVLAAVLKAKELQADEFADPNKRPCQFFIEGRDFQGSVTSLTDMRDATTGPGANRVSVVLGNDATVAASVAYKADYASVGTVLGRYAKNTVQRSAGAVRDGSLKTILNAGYSGGYAYSVYTPTQQNTLHDKGYIFFRTIAGKTGYFINGDNVCCALSDDYSKVTLGRVIDKVARLTDIFMSDYINEDITIDDVTGLLPVAVCAQIEEDVVSFIKKQTTGELSNVYAYVNPAQNLITNPTLAIQVFVLPKGYSEYLAALVRYIDLTTEQVPN